MNKSLPNLDELVPPVRTVLESDPDYLRAIGTLCVEIANMELLLAELLGSMLQLGQEFAHRIYFSPQSVSPRLAIVQNAAESALQGSPECLRRVTGLIREVRRYADRRGDILERSWGLVAGKADLQGSSILMREEEITRDHLVPLEHVKSAVYSVRLLATEAIELIKLIRKES